MADKKISQLTAITAANITGSEDIPLVQTGTTKKTSLEEIQHYIVTHLEPTTLTVSAGNTYDLGATIYDQAELVVLSWSGGAGTATLTVSDVAGNKILIIERDYPQGANSEFIQLNGHKGVLYYSLKTDKTLLSKKMIILE